MNKFRELAERDPKRFWVFIVIGAAGIGTLIVGMVTGGVEKAPPKSEINALEIPVDTNQLKNHSSGADRFFSLNEDSEVIDSTVERHNYSSSSTYGGGYKPPKPRLDYSPLRTERDEPVIQVAEPVSGKRKRSPSDEFGNVTGKKSKESSCKAVINNRNRTVKSGSLVTMHTSADFTLSGIFVPKGTILQGTAEITNERVKILIKQIKIGTEFHSVKWKVYDSGIDGIYVPSRVADDVAKGVAQEGAEGTKVEGNLPIVGSIKVSLKKKNQEQSVVLTDGYKLTVHE